MWSKTDGRILLCVRNMGNGLEEGGKADNLAAKTDSRSAPLLPCLPYNNSWVPYKIKQQQQNPQKIANRRLQEAKWEDNKNSVKEGWSQFFSHHKISPTHLQILLWLMPTYFLSVSGLVLNSMRTGTLPACWASWASLLVLAMTLVEEGLAGFQAHCSPIAPASCSLCVWELIPPLLQGHKRLYCPCLWGSPPESCSNQKWKTAKIR